MRDLASGRQLSVPNLVRELTGLRISKVIAACRLNCAERFQRAEREPDAVQPGHQRADQRVATEQCQEPWDSGRNIGRSAASRDGERIKILAPARKRALEYGGRPHRHPAIVPGWARLRPMRITGEREPLSIDLRNGVEAAHPFSVGLELD